LSTDLKPASSHLLVQDRMNMKIDGNHAFTPVYCLYARGFVAIELRIRLRDCLGNTYVPRI
jgi:hypothetical protein